MFLSDVSGTQFKQNLQTALIESRFESNSKNRNESLNTERFASLISLNYLLAIYKGSFILKWYQNKSGQVREARYGTWGRSI